MQKTKDICYIGIFAAIIAVSAQIIIPLPPVPITLQTFAISFAGVALGAKRGTLAALIYILLGAVGLPIFAGFGGGIGHIAGPSGGFIMSFPLMALAAGFYRYSHIWLVVGVLVNYLCGMLYFAWVTNNSLTVAFTLTILRFIPGDIVKIALAGIIGERVRKAV